MKRICMILLSAIILLVNAPMEAKASYTINLDVEKNGGYSEHDLFSPGDTIEYTVYLSNVIYQSLGTLQFDLEVSDGLSIVSITKPEGLEDTMDSDGDIIIPDGQNMTWAYSAKSNGFLQEKSSDKLAILHIKCKVNENVNYGTRVELSVTNSVATDNTVNLNSFNVREDSWSAKIENRADYVSALTLSESKITIKVGETKQLTANVTPSSALNKNLTWEEIHNDGCEPTITVENGLVTGIKVGDTSLVRVTAVDTRLGYFTKFCSVTVVCNHSMTKVSGVEPTCKETGTKEHYHCSGCNKNFSDAAGTNELSTVSIPINANNHLNTEIRNAVAATETSTGYTGDTYCTVCNKLIQSGSSIPKLDHTHNMKKVTGTAPTCGKDGILDYYECTKCGKKYNDAKGTIELTSIVAPATGNHKHTEVRNAVAATEEKTGYTGDTYCTDCGKKIATGSTIAKLPHTHNMTKTEAVKATCTTNGNIEYYTCTKCGKKYSDAAGKNEVKSVVVKATGHSDSGAWKSNENEHWKNCSSCGVEINRAKHTYSWKLDKPATENETGIKHEECVCGLKCNENTEVAKLDHVHTDIQKHEAIAGTCSKTGTIEYWTCGSEKCDGKYYAEEECQLEITDITSPIVPENHVYDSETDSDCNECGYERFYPVIEVTNNGLMEDDFDGDLVIKIDGDYALFQSLSVNGNILVKDVDYTVSEGSTIITLKNLYLKSLEVGKYEVEATYSDGKIARTNITINEVQDSETEETQDTEANIQNNQSAPNNTNRIITTIVGVVVVGILAVVVVFLYRKMK